MPRRKTTIPVIAGAQSVEQIASALSLLTVLSDPKFQKVAKANLETLGSATQANTKALEGLQGRLAEVDVEAEADREAAAQELTEAKTEAEVIITNANGKAEGRIAILNERERNLADSEVALKSAQGVQEKREADFERETAGLRKALR